MNNTISIIGRVNVGKSTLFNRLSRKSEAMISDIPGTTRDLKYSKIEWRGKKFELIDTGGFLAEQKTSESIRQLIHYFTRKQQKKIKKQAIDDIDKQVERQARKAVERSNIILFLVDAKEGLNPQDKQIANYLRKIKNLSSEAKKMGGSKKIILTINKCDNQKIRQQTAEFHKLGLGEPVLISAANGSGTGDLLDNIIKNLTPAKNTNKNKKDSRPIRVSIIGKPNVGKSSLLNSLIGEEKAIISPIPHTTREPNDALIKYSVQQLTPDDLKTKALNKKNKNILLIDTAGIRRKAKVQKKTLEGLGVSMSIKTLRRSDIALLILDISEKISKQDLILGKLIAESNAGIIIIANKYDLIKEKANQNLTKKYTEYIYNHFPHLDWAPIVFISAKTGWNIQKILQLIIEVEKQKNIKIPNSALNRLLKSIIKKQPPPKKREGYGNKTKTKRAFISRFQQIDIKPPTFCCTIDTKEKLSENYRKYIINQLRKKFGFKGTPIKLVIKWNKKYI